MNLQPLLGLLADGAFHSGQQLGGRLGISRAAVWKQVERLRTIGVDIHSVAGKGYRLPFEIVMLDKPAVLASLGSRRSQWRDRLDVLFSIDSTNTEAMRKIQAGHDSAVVVAEHQTMGRGRRGRAWVSPPGANVYLSMVATFQSGIAALEGLSLSVAVLVARVLRCAGCEGLELKWPNDIHLSGRKVAGILLEITGDVAGPCRVIIGVGVNFRMPALAGSVIDQPYTDLASSCVDLPDRNRFIAMLIAELEDGLADFARSGFQIFHAEWSSMDAYKGRNVELCSGATVTAGVAQGVDGSGALMLQTAEGLKVVAGGEIAPSLRATASVAG